MKNEIKRNEDASKLSFKGHTGNPFKKGGMFEGASRLVFEMAKELRKNMTDSEKALWIHLNGGITGCKIRRQHPIGIYIADFYCHKAKLIIEVDGAIHNQEAVRESDKIRQKDLEDWGYTIIRFTNQEIKTEIENVFNHITKTVQNLINQQSLKPFPKAEGSKSPL